VVLFKLRAELLFCMLHGFFKASLSLIKSPLTLSFKFLLLALLRSLHSYFLLVKFAFKLRYLSCAGLAIKYR
jgi:hypothetical protein